MALVNGSDYDHVDMHPVSGGDVTRHMLKDAQARDDISTLKSALNPVIEYQFEQGTLNTVSPNTPLNPEYSAQIVRSKDFAAWSAGKYISMADGWQARILLCDSSGNYITDVPWTQYAASNNAEAVQAKVCIRRNDNASITPEDVKNAILYTTIEVFAIPAKADQAEFNTLFKAVSPLLQPLVEQGNWGTVSGYPLNPQDLDYVIRTKNYYPWTSGMSVKCNDGFQARLLLVGNDYTYIEASLWGQSATLKNTNAAYCMVCIKTIDNSALSPNQITDAVEYTDVPLYIVPAKANQADFEALESTVNGIGTKLEKTNENILPLFNSLMEQGNWSTIDTSHPLRPQDLNYVIRTKDYTPWQSGMKVVCNAGYQTRILLVGSNYNYVTVSLWGQEATLENTTAAYCMVCIKTDNNTALTPDQIGRAVAYSDIPLYAINPKASQEDFEELETVVDGIVENGEAGVYVKMDVTPAAGVMSKTGTIANIGQHASINVSRGEKYEIIAYKYGDDYPAYIFRKDGTIVSYSENASQLYRRWLVTVPSGVDEMIVNANAYLLYVAKYQLAAPMPYSKWHGKKIAWFGTSIPEPSSYNPVTGYPEYVGELLGATVYNEAVGSSCARRGTRSAESANDPYGVTNMGIGALWALGGTIAEKTDLTTNWESKWRAITGYDVAMTDAIKNKAIACSYENKLMKYVNDTPVDLYVFDHGYNDWRSNSADNVANPDNPFDRSTYQGAMNTFIAAILAANPHANIVLISHYETQREPGVIDMQESVAEYWGLPLIRICDKLGWAWNRTITSTGYWQTASGGGVWIGSGGTSTEYHLPQLHMQDGKHPNTDLSGKSCMDIGNIIAAELNMLPPHNQ